MDPLDYRIYYERHLPHFQPPGATLFVTFRLAGSIPVYLQEELKVHAAESHRRVEQIEDPAKRMLEIDCEQRRLFAHWDQLLNQASSGPRWLTDPRVAAIVEESLQKREGQMIQRVASCIMPNHVHLIFAPLPSQQGNDYGLSRILHAVKGYSAHAINKALQRSGAVWQAESYDHVVRDEAELGRIVEYVLENPVKAGLVEKREDWPWCYSVW